MSVNRFGQITGNGGCFDRECCFSDHFACSHTNDSDAQNTFGLGVDDHLRQAFAAGERNRAT